MKRFSNTDLLIALGKVIQIMEDTHLVFNNEVGNKSCKHCMDNKIKISNAAKKSRKIIEEVLLRQESIKNKLKARVEYDLGGGWKKVS